MADYNLIAIWGAGLSTILAFVKFWEIWQNRIKIEVSYNFTSNPDIGNLVIIRNLSSTPIIITYWELLWCKWGWFCRKPADNIGPDEFNEDLKLSGHSSTKLTFLERDHFDWSSSALGKNKIYLRLHVAGKARPILKKVYG